MEIETINNEVTLPTAKEQLAEMAANDIDNMDAMPFDDEIPDENGFENEFHECETWSEDDEGNIVPTALL